MFTCLLSVVVGVDPELDPTKNYSIKFLEQHLDFLLQERVENLLQLSPLFSQFSQNKKTTY